MRLVLVLVAVVSYCRSIAAAEDDALARFNASAAAAEEECSHSKGPDSDRYLRPVVEGLVADDSAIRDRAIELTISYVRKGWIAFEQFDRLSWEKCDARGKGLFLWCAASRRTWDTKARPYPLAAEEVFRLWVLAAREPVTLPFLRETALTWSIRRSARWPTIRLGDGLASDARACFAKQFLSLFSSCETPRERLAVIWMVLDLDVGPADKSLTEWYSTQADPKLRRQLVEAAIRALRPSREEDDAYEKGVAEKSRDALRKRAPVIATLADLAARDWYPSAAEAAESLKSILASYGE